MPRSCRGGWRRTPVSGRNLPSRGTIRPLTQTSVSFRVHFGGEANFTVTLVGVGGNVHRSTRRDAWEALLGEAQRHAGIVSRDHLRVAGLSDKQVRHRVASSLLVPFHGSFRVPLGVPSWVSSRPPQFQRALQQATAVNPPHQEGLLLSGPAAAVLLGAESRGAEADWWSTWAPGVFLAYLDPARHRKLDGVSMIRAPFDGTVTRRWGLLMADLETALLDTLDQIPPSADRQMEALLDLCLQRKWLTVEGLSRRLIARESGTSVPSRRLSTLRRVVRAAQEGTHSKAERAFAALLREHKLRMGGTAGWRANHEVSGCDADGTPWAYRPDFAWPAQRVVVEIDGRAFHSDDAAFERDRLRIARFAAAGWTVVPVTWSAMQTRPGQVIAQLRELLSPNLAKDG